MASRATRWLIILLLSGLAVPACGALSSSDEIRLGKRVMSEVRPLGLTRNPALDAIGARLAKCTQRQDLTWHFFVVEGMKEYNAFAAPGGFVFISRPYFEKLNTDEAAFVIGHEMAHVDLRHVEQTMKRAQQANFGDLLFRVITKSDVLGTAADVGATAYVSHYSRMMERQADFTGYGFAKKAGYNAGAAVSALSKLGNEKESAWKTSLYGSILSSPAARISSPPLAVTNLPPAHPRPPLLSTNYAPASPPWTLSPPSPSASSTPTESAGKAPTASPSPRSCTTGLPLSGSPSPATTSCIRKTSATPSTPPAARRPTTCCWSP